MQATLIIAGVILSGWALRSWEHPVLRKLGAVLYLVASYLAGWMLSGSHGGGVAAVASWFLLPWVEILLRVRRMRLPLDKSLVPRRPPPRDEFPHLSELTSELEAEGFEQAEDAGWDWADIRQFVRVFHHAPSRTQAAIHLNQQRNLSVVYVSVTSRTQAGLTVTTWNYPFSSTMQEAPGFVVNRAPGVESFSGLLAEHRSCLAGTDVDETSLAPLDSEHLTEQISADLRAQVDYNLSSGILTESGGGTFRYSWRGCFYLYRQFVKDMVKFA